MLTGAPRLVLSRGDVVVRDGEILSRPGRGQYVEREPTAARLA